ncbi:hypothetical protein MAJ_07425, partial [Metarhizium majus ARSEF 297]
MSSPLSSPSPAGSRSITPFTNLNTDVESDPEWVKVPEHRNKTKARSSPFTEKHEPTIPSTTPSSETDELCRELSISLRVALKDLKHANTRGSNWTNGYVKTLRPNSPTGRDSASQAFSPLASSSWSDYQYGVESHCENRPGTGCGSTSEISAETAPINATNSNVVEMTTTHNVPEVTEIRYLDAETGKWQSIKTYSADILTQQTQPVIKLRRVNESTAASAEGRSAGLENRETNTASLDM